MASSELSENRTDNLGKESTLTILSALQHFPEKGVFSVLHNFFYSADEDISCTAIRAASSHHNMDAVPHLLQLIERAKVPTRIEAIRALARIHDPLTVEKLLKYFPLFQEIELKSEILRTVNAIIPSHNRVAELNRAILIDSKEQATLKEVAVQGLVQIGDYESLSYYFPYTTNEVKKGVFVQILKKDTYSASDFLKRLEKHAHTFTGEILGLYLCAYVIKSANPKNNLILGLLQNATKETLDAYLNGISENLQSIPSVKRVFRILLLMPYWDDEIEKMIDRVLKEVIDLTARIFPRALNELISLATVHLDTLFKKVSKGYLSLKKVKGRDSLLTVLLARLIERIGPEEIVLEVQQHFKDGWVEDADSLIEKIRSTLKDKTEEDRKRFEACIPLFTETERMKRMNTYTMMMNMNPENPVLLKRLARVIKTIGWLGVKTAIKKIWEIHRYSRDEKIVDLETTCIVTLCELFAKNIIPEFHQFFAQSPRDLEIQRAYIRGARFLPPKEVVSTILTLLFRPDTEYDMKLRIIDTLKAMDLSSMERVSQVLIRMYDVSCDPVVSEGAAEVISRYCDVTLFHTLLDLTRKEDTVTKVHGMRILKELAKRDKRVLMDVLTHRLYLLLEDREKDIQIEALFTLLELGDDYAVKILKDWLDSDDDELVTKVLIRVEEVMTDGLLHNVLNLIISEKVSIHERLREILPGLCSGEFSNKVKKILLEHLEAGHGTAHPVDRVRERAGFKEKESLISHPKAEFRFRREHSQILTVFFIDIAGYTDRSTRVDMSSLMLLVKTFEDIVVPHVEGYNGHIIKKMGDGILAAFRQPINAVLASLEIQEEVASHNRYTVDEERFFVRIGLHTGSVIRKEGDIYGDVVNLASRMETAANPGEIMITETVYNEVKDYIQCREIGKINVKGVREAIPAYMPERALEDTQKVLSTRSGDNSVYMNVNKSSSLIKLKESLFSPNFQLPKSLDQSQGIHLMLRELFEEMANAVGELAHDYHEEYVFKRYLQDKWDEMISKLKEPSE